MDNISFLNLYRGILRFSMAGILIVVMPFFAGAAFPCTLWGATGSGTAEKNTLIAKNRDWKPGQTHEIRQILTAGGYTYLGLYACGGESQGLKAGINEKGLVVITATASVIPGDQRSSANGDPISSHEILSGFATVEEVLAQKERFLRSSYYMIADRCSVAVFEGAPDGKTAVRVIDDGYIAQTNHYISPELSFYNGRASASSKKRYERISQLLSSREGKLTLEDFKMFSEDKNAGPDDSIFREGSSAEKSRTVATWIVSIPVSGGPEIYITINDPGKPLKAYSGKLDASFWRVRTASAIQN